MSRKAKMTEMVVEKVKERCDGNGSLGGLQRNLLYVAQEVCGYTKGKPTHSETWWWNRYVNVTVSRKWSSFKIWRIHQTFSQ